jgi:hypothetical protein
MTIFFFVSLKHKYFLLRKRRFFPPPDNGKLSKSLSSGNALLDDFDHGFAASFIAKSHYT